MGQASVPDVPATGTRLRRGDLASRKAASIDVPETAAGRRHQRRCHRVEAMESCLRVLRVWRVAVARHQKRLEISC